jgi:hypothetical protein
MSEAITCNRQKHPDGIRNEKPLSYKHFPFLFKSRRLLYFTWETDAHTEKEHHHRHHPYTSNSWWVQNFLWPPHPWKLPIPASERVQRRALKIILGPDYTSYAVACQTRQMQRVQQRWNELCLKFVLKLQSSNKFSSWLPPTMDERPGVRTMQCGQLQEQNKAQDRHLLAFWKDIRWGSCSNWNVFIKGAMQCSFIYISTLRCWNNTVKLYKWS